MVTYWFIAKKILDIEPIHVFTGSQNALKTRNKSAFCVMVHIHLGIKNASKKNIYIYIRIEVVKQSIPQFYDNSSKFSFQRKRLLKAMRPFPKP